MTEIVTEALIEMHFHSALVQKFQTDYGANFLKLLKPSPQQEAWVGFDQSWALTSLSTGELFQELRTAIRKNKTRISNFYFGYFLQFKPVEKRVRRTNSTPSHYSTPYFNSRLSLQPNKTTGLSQHETLLRLNRILGAIVQYACAMLFDPSDIWQPPDLNKLRLVDISMSPAGWATNQQHYITFQTEDDPSPHWRSDPVIGKAISVDDWMNPNMDLIHPINAGQLISLLQKAYSTIKGIDPESLAEPALLEKTDILEVLPASFTIIEFQKQPNSLLHEDRS